MESVYIHTRIRTRTKARSNKENNISQARFTPFAPKGCIVVPPLKKRERERASTRKHEKLAFVLLVTMRFKQMPPRFNYRIAARILKHTPEEQRSGTGVLLERIIDNDNRPDARL